MLAHHYVVWVSIPDAEDKGGDAITSATEREGFDGIRKIASVVLADPLVELRRVHLDCSQLTSLALDLCRRETVCQTRLSVSAKIRTVLHT